MDRQDVQITEWCNDDQANRRPFKAIGEFKRDINTLEEYVASNSKANQTDVIKELA